MATKSEIFPIVLKLKPDSSLNLDPKNIKFNEEKSDIKIYNDRGGDITDTNETTGDKSKLFFDNDNLLIGYLWDTGETSKESRFNVQDYYLFVFYVGIDYEINGSPTTMKLSFSTKKLLEAGSMIDIGIGK